MKAEDLMIGDWIQNPLGLQGRVGAIKYFPKDSVDNYGGYYTITLLLDTDSYQRFDVKDAKPILLTTEILEKNEFYWGNTASEEDFCGAVGCGYPEKGWCFNEGTGEIKIIFPNETDGKLVRLDDQSAGRHLELVFTKPIMVHELQHCLKLCGIEKEIVL